MCYKATQPDYLGMPQLTPSMAQLLVQTLDQDLEVSPYQTSL